MLKPRILCVDDEPQNLKLLEAVLEPRGYEVIKAVDGEDALVKIGSENPDIVLLDVMMPGMNGMDVCSSIKNDERYRHLPVVMITALRSKEDRVRGIEAGADDFISKPFEQTEVVARIKMLLKIKSLDDRLNQAYHKISTITTFGRTLMSGFDVLSFDFLNDVDYLIGRLLGFSGGAAGKPAMVVVGFTAEDSWHCLLYETGPSGLIRRDLGFNIDECIMKRSGSKMFFYNAEEMPGSEIGRLTEKLAFIDKAVFEAVGFLGADFFLIAFNYGREVTQYDAVVVESLVAQSLFLKSISGQIRETENAFDYMVHALARAAEANDEDTGNHIMRVGEYCAVLARHIGMSEKFVGIVRLQALMHDVGKIHIPSEILKKPGKFTPEEFDEMKKHTLYGVKILGEHVRLTLAKEIAISHHERWDGGGYPFGLRGDQIPISGRIMNIADQYDALRNKRAYKPAFDHETTCKIITEGDGRTMPDHFDPAVLRAFRETASQLEEIYEKLRG